MEHSASTLGVVIRTLNESALIGRCVETLNRQQTDFELDILVVDSGSTDATVEIARGLGARVVEIAPEEFDYSSALNLGISEVRGDLIVLLSAHAIPLDDQWVHRMTAHFSDPLVAGVASGQVPWPRAPSWEVVRLARAFPTSMAEYRGAPAEDMVFSNAASCIRRRVWSAYPFVLPAAEDLDWAQRVVADGWTVVYDPAPQVFHSHDESPRARARRMIDINRVTAGSRRNPARIVKQALGLFYVNAGGILSLEEPVGRRLGHLRDLAQMSWYYAIDFSRPGSIAERRSEDEASALA